MAAPIHPTKHKAFTTEGWGFAPAVADLSAPSVTELTAASGLTLTFFSLADMDALFTPNTDRVTLPLALGEASGFEALGATTYQGGTVRCMWDPQADTGDDDHKAWDTLVDGGTGVAWQRQNVAAETDLVVGQKVHLIPIEIGPKTPTKTGTGNDGIYTFDAPFGIIAVPKFAVALVA